MNIVLNAYDAMREKGGTLLVSTRISGEEVVLRFKDNGCGMDTRTLERLRSSLFTGGTHGLSLVTRKLAGVFGEDFSIDITSEPGEGTCFRLSFPV